MISDREFWIARGWSWRAFSVGGVAYKGHVEVWMPEGRVMIGDYDIRTVHTEQDVADLEKGLAL